MIRHTAALFATCLVMLAAGAQTLRVPDDHPSIQAAIDAAPDRATIVVAEGVYNENILLTRPMSLRADGEVTLRSIDRQRPVFALIGVWDGVISGLAFEALDPRPSRAGEAVTEAVVVVAGGSPIFDSCTVRNGSHTGIKIAGETTVHFADCIIDGHGQSGAYIMGIDAQPRFTGCQVTNNQLHGLRFVDGASGFVEDCDLSHNGGNGASLAGHGTAPTLTGNRAERNHFNGIVVMEGAGGTLEDNACLGNGASGINVQQVDDSLVVRGNHCEGNFFSGFYLAQETGATIEKNRFLRNGVISSGEISLLMRDEDFEALDVIEAHLLEAEARFPSGAWQLGFFYDFLAGGWRGTPQSHHITFVEWCGRWQYAQPQSIVPRIARGKWLAQQAWAARGAALNDAVDSDAWEGFAHLLAEAYSALLEAQELNPEHPHALAELVHVLASLESMPSSANRARNAAWSQFDPPAPSAVAFFERGVKAAPTYLPLYTNRARFLMPRWGAPKGALEAFAAQHATATADELGDGLYAILANHILHSFYLWADSHAFFTDHAFAWQRIVQGHRDLIERYPDASFWPHSLALHAALQGEKAIAAEIFEQIDAANGAWDSDVWQVSDRFDTYRAWALDEGPYPEAAMELLLAIQMGDPHAVRALLEEGLVVNAIGNLGYTPLSYAVDRGDAAITAVLLEFGADPELQNYKEAAPIHKAAGRNDLEILELLLEHAAEVDFLSTDGSTALMYAAFNGQLPAIHMLLEHGANIDHLHPSGSTALIVAARQGQTDAARVLLEAGANPHLATIEGQTALDLARMTGNGALIDLLEAQPEPVQPEEAEPEEAGLEEAGPEEAGPEEAGPEEAGPEEAKT